LSIWTYYRSKNPKWDEEGIDDDEIDKIDETGKTESEAEKIKEIKLNSYLNISVCCLKTKQFTTAISACEEALRIDN
jgi:hypothetical protein